MAWTEGEKVGAYILGKQLGQGGMATVYHAHHPQLERDVAIKVMHQNFLDDEGFVARFKREAQIVAKLSHPHIVPVYDFDEHNHQPYLVMKYVQGFTLKKQLIKNPPDLDGILYIVKAVGDALNYAHEQGVLHRDIKPSNIVIDRNGTPYLTDFGLARLASSGESTMSADMLLGTPHYISPEQARGLNNLDGRTDIYSLGIVLYELLVGKVPFTGDSAFSIIHDHIYTPLPAPSIVNPEIPEAVERVLYKALEKEPKKRYSTAGSFIHDLTTAIHDDNLTSLDPNRADVAAISLAKIRDDYEQQLAESPPLTRVMSPLSEGSSVRTATIYPKQSPFYEQDRFWTISGCASLLLITFAIFAVFLSMSENLQELVALADESDNNGIEIETDIAENPFVDMANLDDAEYYEETYGIVLEQQASVPVIHVPYVELDNIAEASNDPVIALLRARSLYEETSEIDARREILSYLPSDNVQSIIYLISASQIALASDDINAAVIFAIVATENAQQDTTLFNFVRPLTLEFIYRHAGNIQAFDLRRSISNFVSDNSLVSENEITAFSESEVAQFAAIRNLIVHGNTRLAQSMLLREEAAVVPIDAEYALLRAETQMALSNEDNARRILDGILEDDNVPEWIITLVENYINDME